MTVDEARADRGKHREAAGDAESPTDVDHRYEENRPSWSSGGEVRGTLHLEYAPAERRPGHAVALSAVCEVAADQPGPPPSRAASAWSAIMTRRPASSSSPRTVEGPRSVSAEICWRRITVRRGNAPLQLC